MTITTNETNVTFTLSVETTDDARSLINILSVLKYGTEEFNIVNNAVYTTIAAHLNDDPCTDEWDEWYRVLGYLEAIYGIKEAERDRG